MSIRPEPSVLWREGMLLCPQHLQAYSREVRARQHCGDTVGRAGAHGLVAFDVDVDALTRDLFQVRSCEALLRDGTWLRFPETAALPPREFAKHFTGSTLDVWIGVPAEQPGVPQIGSDPQRAWRFKAQTRPVDDENELDSARDLDFRELQARLFFGDEDRSGFECLRVARLVRRGRPVPKSQLLDTDLLPLGKDSQSLPPFPADIPALLACGASPPLMKGLRALADMTRAEARDLARRLPPNTTYSSSDRAADIAGFAKLQAINRALARVEQLAGLPQLHPFDAYQGLVDIVGGLAIFDGERVVAPLPVYDHDQLGNGFAALFVALHKLIAAQVTYPYDTLELRADPLREGFFEAELPAHWMTGRTLVYLAVEAAKSPEEVIEHVANCVKLVAAEDVERFLTGVVPGIELTFEQTPPVAFPKSTDRHFFRIQTEGASRDSWLAVERGRKIALLTFLSAVGPVRFHLYVELRG